VSDFPLTCFLSAAEWRDWLRRYHQSARSILLQLRKTHAKIGITYAEALDEALCYGWIDGVRRAVDGDTFSIRFTPRKPKSIWSLVNVRHAERLIQQRRMTAAGKRAFAGARRLATLIQCSAEGLRIPQLRRP
jgi:uncharacterized protein YdeI (YjbR/CyaY-like superfamily)